MTARRSARVSHTAPVASLGPVWLSRAHGRCFLNGYCGKISTGVTDSSSSAISAIELWYGITDVEETLLVSCSWQNVCLCVNVRYSNSFNEDLLCSHGRKERWDCTDTMADRKQTFTFITSSAVKPVGYCLSLRNQSNGDGGEFTLLTYANADILIPSFEEYHQFMHKKPVCWVAALHWHFQYSEAVVRNPISLGLSCSCGPWVPTSNGNDAQILTEYQIMKKFIAILRYVSRC